MREDILEIILYKYLQLTSLVFIDFNDKYMLNVLKNVLKNIY